MAGYIAVSCCWLVSNVAVDAVAQPVSLEVDLRMKGFLSSTAACQTCVGRSAEAMGRCL